MEITFANNNTSTVNGVLKRHVGVEDGIAYRECQRNHAASQGRHVLDGCGEFMPAPTATATDPISLRCMACGCHRNFHRRDPEGVIRGAVDTHVVEYRPQNRHHPPPPPGSELIQAVTACQVRSPKSPPLISSTYHHTGSAPHMLLARASNGGYGGIITTTAYQQQQIFNNGNHRQPQLLPNSTRKRFRTKFSQEQKDRMQEFAENLEWKMVRSNDELINGFCHEIGVERGVFKVWMHNNKNTTGKKSESTNNYGIISANNQGVLSIKNEYNYINQIEGDGNENGMGIGIGNSHSSSISQEYNGTTHLSNASSSS